ncbi:MAG: thiamine phosphate synthase [Hyphomicrobiaceae bacterium]|nr:thiamine phosphate synthase [Hyphomicrobiaceae bacterium]
MSVNDKKTRLYLNIPATDLDGFDRDMSAVEQLPTQLDLACVSLKLHDDPAHDGPLKPFIDKIQQKGVAVVLELPQLSPLDNELGDGRELSPALLAKSPLVEHLARIDSLQADGLHLPPPLASPLWLEKARMTLGKDVIIGVDCGLSRHLAMSLGDAGADYIGFSIAQSEPYEQLVNMVGWWQDLFEIPCVALNPGDRTELETLLQIPTDFIALGAALWPRFRDDPDFAKWVIGQCPLTEQTRQE